MARYSNIFGGGMATCSLNGRQVSMINGQIFVDGVLYLPAGNATAAPAAAGNATAPAPQGPGKIVDHVFKIKDKFDRVHASSFIDVEFTQSSDPDKFEVTGRLPENLIPAMMVEVIGSTLYVSLESGIYDSYGSAETPVVRITAPALIDVQASGSGDFTVKGDLKVDGGFFLFTAGSGDFTCGQIETVGQSCDLTVKGSGDARVDGIKCNYLTVNVSGSADVDCGSVESQICEISVAGSGNVTLAGKAKDVEFSVAGSGDIDATGLTAEKGRASVSGSGDIRCDVRQLSDRVRGSGDIYNLRD